MIKHTGLLLDLDNEKRPDMLKLAKPLTAMLAYAADNEKPKTIDPRQWHRAERQKRNDCQGFSASSVGEAAYTGSTGRVIQFSPHFCYRTAQEIDGIRGDNGSTISGGYEAAHKYGMCPLDACPYPANYSSAITAEMRSKASAYKIGSFAVCNDYDDVVACLIGGMGVNWGLGWDFSGSEKNVLTKFTGNGVGHATCLLGYSERLDKLGRPYIWLFNSGYPVPGWYEVSADAVNKALAHKRTVAMAMSRLDYPAPEPRTFNPLGV